MLSDFKDRNINLIRNKIIREKKPYATDIDGDDETKFIYDKEVISQSIDRLFMTIRGERVFLPGFGINIEEYFHEPADPYTMERLKAEIIFQLNTYETRIVIIDEGTRAWVDPLAPSQINIVISYYITLRAEEVVTYEAVLVNE